MKRQVLFISLIIAASTTWVTQPVKAISTGGELLRGVRYDSYGARSQSLVMRSRSGTVRVIDTQHRVDRIGQYSSVEFR